MLVSSDGSILDGKTKKNDWQLIDDVLLCQNQGEESADLYDAVLGCHSGERNLDDTENRKGLSKRSNIDSSMKQDDRIRARDREWR